MTNSRFEDLEKRCFKLKFKAFMKAFVTFLFFFGAVSGYYFYFMSKDDVQRESVKLVVEDKKEIITKNIDIPKVQEFQEIKLPISVEKNETLEINTTVKIKEENVYHTIYLEPTVTLPKIEQETKENKSTEEVKVEPQQEMGDTKEKEIQKEPLLSVKAIDYESKLVLEFQKSQGFEAALNLARYFFEKELYEKSLHWAKIASTKQPFEDLPWILYAKSKYNLGKKSEAINSLELYLQYYNSQDVSNLLEEMKKEK